MRSIIKFSLVLFGTTALPALNTANAQERVKQPAYAMKGIVVSADRMASEVGTRILRKGGNAVDAAVAAAYALAVTQPFAGNIGGGGFMLLRLANGHTTTIDYREKAPAAARQDMFLDESGNVVRARRHKGHLAVGVPGTVAGLSLALKKYGTMPLSELIRPAAELAESGFPLSHFKSRQMALYAADFLRHAATSRIFLKDGKPYEFGDLFVQADLARTLKRIAAGGAKEFYQGETARLIANEMHENAGLITMDDLASYKAVERAPIEVTYRGYRIVTMAPPSGGGVTLGMMLNILEGYDLPKMGHNSAQYLHTLAEAMRRAYANRARYIGDPDFNVDMPITRLLSKEWAASQRQSVVAGNASPSNPAQFDWPYESSETTHFCVVDKDGNLVSNTFTLEGAFGAKIAVSGGGFLLNGEMGDFNPKQGLTDTTGTIGTEPNLVEPGKRMLSSMTPAIITKDGYPFMAVGTPGGRKITNTVLQVILNVIDFNFNIYQAIDASRVHHQWLPDTLRIDNYGITKDTKDKLAEMGYKLAPFPALAGNGRAMAILIDPRTGIRSAAADPRSPDGAVIVE